MALKKTKTGKIIGSAQSFCKSTQFQAILLINFKVSEREKETESLERVNNESFPIY